MLTGSVPPKAATPPLRTMGWRWCTVASCWMSRNWPRTESTRCSSAVARVSSTRAGPAGRDGGDPRASRERSGKAHRSDRRTRSHVSGESRATQSLGAARVSASLAIKRSSAQARSERACWTVTREGGGNPRTTSSSRVGDSREASGAREAAKEGSLRQQGLCMVMLVHRGL